MSKTLLVIDDSSTIQEAVRHSLVGQDWEVAAAVDLAGAQAILAERTVDAVLCDVSPGDEDGYEICRQLHAAPDLQGAPVLLMGSKVNSTAALAVGAATTVPKPFDSDELVATLQEVLEHSTFSLDFDDFPAGPESGDEDALVLEPLAEGDSEPFEDAVPADGPELEIIDLGDDEEFEDLELLEDLQPIRVVEPEAPETVEVSPAGSFSADFGLSHEPIELSADDALEGLTPMPEVPAQDGGPAPLDVVEGSEEAQEAPGVVAPGHTTDTDEWVLDAGDLTTEVGDSAGAGEALDAVPEGWDVAAPLQAGELTAGVEPAEEADDDAVGLLGTFELDLDAGTQAEEPSLVATEEAPEEPSLVAIEETPEESWAREEPAVETPPAVKVEEEAEWELDLRETVPESATEPESESELEPTTVAAHEHAASGDAVAPEEEAPAEPDLDGDRVSDSDLDAMLDGVLTSAQPEVADPPPAEPGDASVPEPAAEPDGEAEVALEETGETEEDASWGGFAPSGQPQGAWDEGLQDTEPADAPSLGDTVAPGVERAVREALEASLDAEKLAPVVERIVERVVWEVVPQLAERLINEAIAQLQEDPGEG